MKAIKATAFDLQRNPANPGMSFTGSTRRSMKQPKNRRITVKVINHLGDEVMKVFKV
jgi:hypothetical protein